MSVAIRFVSPSGRECRVVFDDRNERDRWSLLGLLDEIRNQFLGRGSTRAQELEPLDDAPTAAGRVRAADAR